MKYLAVTLLACTYLQGMQLRDGMEVQTTKAANLPVEAPNPLHFQEEEPSCSDRQPAKEILQEWVAEVTPTLFEEIAPDSPVKKTLLATVSLTAKLEKLEPKASESPTTVRLRKSWPPAKDLV